MNAKTVRICSILTSVMLFLHVGCAGLNLLLSSMLRNTLVSLPTGVFCCLTVMLPTVVLLIFGIKQAKQKQGKADLIFSIVTLTVSLVWIVLAVFHWGTIVAQNFIVELYYRLDVAMSMADLLTLLSYLNVAYMAFTTVIALYLLVMYLVSVLRAKQKWLQIKAELHKPAAALLILVPNLMSLLQTVLNLILGRVSTDLYITVSRIMLSVSFGITTLLTIALAVFVLTFGLIIKNKPATASEAQDAEQTEQTENQESSDLPFNVPAGINPNDI